MVVVLAAPVGPEHAEDFTALGMKADVIDGHHLTATQIAKGFREALDVDHGSGAISQPLLTAHSVKIISSTSYRIVPIGTTIWTISPIFLPISPWPIGLFVRILFEL